MSVLTPSRGYLVRALYEWLVDNDLTPHLVVTTEVPGTQVPIAFVKDGHITLNLAPTAVRDLLISNEAVSFSARFSGKPMQVYVPIAATKAIFAKENGLGMGFGMEPGADLLEAQQLEEQGSSTTGVSGAVKSPDDGTKTKRPTLKVIK